MKTENTINPLNLAEKSTKRWEFFLFLAFIVGIGALAFAIPKLKVSPVTHNVGDRLVNLPVLKTVPYSSDSVLQPSVVFHHPVQEIQPLLSSNQWCDGDETICTTATTARPKEILQKLIAAIPQNKGKQYKIYLSVKPFTE